MASSTVGIEDGLAGLQVLGKDGHGRDSNGTGEYSRGDLYDKE